MNPKLALLLAVLPVSLLLFGCSDPNDGLYCLKAHDDYKCLGPICDKNIFCDEYGRIPPPAHD